MLAEIFEYSVETSVCDWIEVKIKHKKLNKKYIKLLFSKFKELDFVYDTYQADNGLFRLNMIGNYNRCNPFLHKGIPPDICISVYKGYCIIIRNHREGYEEMENNIISIIVENLK